MGDILLDAHGQPLNRGLSWSRNKKKSLEALLGILAGLTADRRLDERELLVLDTWLREQEFLQNDPDVVDLLDCTSQILRDGVVTDDELEDAKELILTVLEYRSEPHERLRDAVNNLLGAIHGVVANRHLVDEEIYVLRRWLSETLDGELVETWPGNLLHQRIESVMADGIITIEERQDLLETLQSLVGDESSAAGMSTSFPVETVDAVDFCGRSFCLTGRFVYGTRRRCEDEIARRGGEVRTTVTKDLSYLVLGTVASRDWVHTSFGRKIEKAMVYKSGGRGIAIISEDTWSRYL